MPGLRQDFAKGMINDMYGYYFDGESYDTEPTVFDKIFQEKKIDGAYWQTTSVVDMEEYTETPETEGYTFDSPIEGYTVIGKARTFTAGKSFTYDAVEDHQKIKDILRQSAEGWGRGKKRTMEKFFAKFFNYGGYTAGHEVFNGSITNVVTDSSGNYVYDSKPFFNLSGNKRSSKGGGTYYNGLSLTFNADNLKTLYLLGTVTNSYNEDDSEVDIDYDYILYPGNLQFDVREVLESTLVPGKTDNTKNVLQDLLEPIKWQYLTNANAFFIGKKKKGLLWLNRRGVHMDFFDDKKARRWRAVSSLRFGGMVTNWRFHAGSNFSTS